MRDSSIFESFVQHISRITREHARVSLVVPYLHGLHGVPQAEAFRMHQHRVDGRAALAEHIQAVLPLSALLLCMRGHFLFSPIDSRISIEGKTKTNRKLICTGVTLHLRN